jgi:predicted TIM-barrel fold metal-dependent hydrolase
MIDTNVSLGRWPFRRLPAEDAGALANRLRRGLVEQAWVGSLDGLFQRDVAGVNARLADECRNADPERLVPFGTVNPALPDWEEDLRRCDEIHRFRGIRVHPAFHGYALADPPFARLLTLAAGRGLVVELVVTMEDLRTQHPVFRVPPVDLRALESLVRSISGLRLVVLNAFQTISLDDAQRLAGAGEISFDIAMLEGVDRLAKLVDRVGTNRCLFGSHFPLFYLESAALKLCETKLARDVITQIVRTNAHRVLKP